MTPSIRSTEKGYSPEQIQAWATGRIDREEWNRSLLEHRSIVAVKGREIVGFGDMDSTGYLDRLYVHKAYQGQGIATAICDRLESTAAEGRILVHASLTARPFFEKRGYRVRKEQQVERRGVLLTNFQMEKRIERQDSIKPPQKPRKNSAAGDGTSALISPEKLRKHKIIYSDQNKELL